MAIFLEYEVGIYGVREESIENVDISLFASCELLFVEMWSPAIAALLPLEG